MGGITIGDVDHLGINKDSKANLLSKLGFALTNLANITLMAKQRLEIRAKAQSAPQLICEALGVSPEKLRAKVHNVEHHLCHAASCFLVSEFDRAAIFSVDGFGDFASTLTALGHENQIDVLDRTLFPHSLGIVYTMICQFIGYDQYGDEGKVMGLAPYGKPVYDDFFNRWSNSSPRDASISTSSTSCITARASITPSTTKATHSAPLFGGDGQRVRQAARHHGELTQRHGSGRLASEMPEEAYSTLNHLHEQTRCEALPGRRRCSELGGQRPDLRRTPFRKIYTQAAAGDDGTALGSPIHS